MPDRYPRRLLPPTAEPPGARVPYGPELPPDYVAPPPEPPPLSLGHPTRISDDRSLPVRFLDYLVGDEGGGEEIFGSKLLGRASVAWDKLGRPPEGVMGAAPETPKGVADLMRLPQQARGLYSRVNELATKVGKGGITPGRLAKLLRGDTGLAEEAASRKLNELITGKGGAKTTHARTITKADLDAHLAANPAPVPEVTPLGGALPVRQQGNQWVVRYPDGSTRSFARQDEARAIAESGTLPTKYNQTNLNVPGGKDYRETLLQLPVERKKQGRYKVEVRSPTSDVVYRGTDVGATDVERLRQTHERAGGTVSFEEIETPIGGWKAGHYDQPNVVAHVRHDERTLAAPPPEMPKITQPTWADLEAQGYRMEELDYNPYTGQRSVSFFRPSGEWAGGRSGTRLSVEELKHDYALDNSINKYNAKLATPTGEKGRFLQEVQSDWHQRGKEQGYQTPEDQAALTAARAEYAAAEDRYRDTVAQLGGGTLDENDMIFLSQVSEPGDDIEQTLMRIAERENWHPGRRFDNPTQRANFSNQAREWLSAQPGVSPVSRGWNAANTLHIERQKLTEARSALQQIDSRVKSQLPDAPFKESWPDLALKQQVLDVAESPDLDWIGMTTGKTQADRYDMSKYVGKLEYDPHSGRLYGWDVHDPQKRVVDVAVDPDELSDHIGKAPAAALRTKIDEYNKGQEWERSQWGVEPDADKPGRFNIVDPNGEVRYNYAGDPERYSSVEYAQSAIDQILEESRSYADEVELPALTGQNLTVGGEGQRFFYDELLPSRLRKILAPFGGTVEKGRVSAVPTGAIPQGNPSLEEAEAWIARLTPEMKERIRREGIPLMMLPFLLAAGTASQVGTPPPVQPPSPSSKE